MNLNETMRGGTFCLSKAGLTIGTSTTCLNIAAPNGAGVDFCIKGVIYHLADGVSKPVTAAATQPVLTKCIYVVCLNAAGTLSTVKGTEKLVTALAAGDVLEFPEVDDDVCPIGYVTVSLANAATFTAGTTALSATDVTDAYFDMFAIPVSPLTA
jgi:hypothetical protein